MADEPSQGETQQPIRLFVYGTLMSGEPYHHRLMEEARFVAKTLTEPAYELLDLGEYPGLVEGGETAVTGEVFEIDEHIQKAVDRLEGHPHLYRRTTVRLAGGEEAVGYVLPRKARESYPVVSHGDWKRHQRRK